MLPCVWSAQVALPMLTNPYWILVSCLFRHVRSVSTQCKQRHSVASSLPKAPRVWSHQHLVFTNNLFNCASGTRGQGPSVEGLAAISDPLFAKQTKYLFYRISKAGKLASSPASFPLFTFFWSSALNSIIPFEPIQLSLSLRSAHFDFPWAKASPQRKALLRFEERTFSIQKRILFSEYLSRHAMYPPHSIPWHEGVSLWISRARLSANVCRACSGPPKSAILKTVIHLACRRSPNWKNEAHVFVIQL